MCNCKNTTMDKLKLGEAARVIAFANDRDVIKRFGEFGLVPGGSVRCVIKGRNDDMSAYTICGATVAIRYCDARLVSVCAL